MNDVCIISWCTLGLNVEAVDWICLFLPWHLLISRISCIYLSNLLDKWYVPSMLICSFWSLWLELLPNIIKLHLTSFSTQRQSSKKTWNWNNDIRWVSLFHGVWHPHTVSFPKLHSDPTKWMIFRASVSSYCFINMKQTTMTLHCVQLFFLKW